MLLRLPPTHSAVTKCMSCVDYRPWPYMLLSSDMRIPEIVYHIVRWDSRPVYISSLLVCVFSTLASRFTTVRHENSGDRIPHRKVGFAASVHFFFIGLWVFDVGLLFYYPTDMRVQAVVYHIASWDSLSLYIVYSIISLLPLVPYLPFCSSSPPSSGPRPFSSTLSSSLLFDFLSLYISHNSIYIYYIYGD